MLSRLGISDTGLAGWAKIHRRPQEGCASCLLAGLAGTVAFSLLYLRGFTWFTPRWHVAALLVLSTNAVHVCGMWLRGPAHAASVLGLALGEPYGTLLVPLSNSLFSTLRFMDAGTDLGFVRVLWDEGPNCTWFGKPTACKRFKVMALAAGGCALLLLISATAVTFVGGQGMLSGQASDRPRLGIALRAIVLLCELCSMVIALIKVLSDSGPDSEVAFILICAALSLSNFCLSCVGMSKVLHTVRRATNRISTRRVSVAPIEQRPVQPPHNGSRSESEAQVRVTRGCSQKELPSSTSSTC
eukprot:jgi/Ulvmu1/9615/UM054_0045.1